MSDESPPPAIRAGDSDRDRSVELLTAAVAEGRLTLEEFGDRVALAQRAQTQDELAALSRDLPAAPPAAEPTAPARHLAVCSNLTRRGPWELPARSEFRCICGTVVLDLSQARLIGQEVELDVFNLCGTVTVLIPDGVRVSVTGGGLFASQVVEPPPDPVAADAPTVRISVRGPCGTLYVRSPGAARNRLARALGGQG